MDRTQIETRLSALTAERAATAARLDAARAAAKQALVEGKKPGPFGYMVEEVEAIDAALADLRDRLTAAHDADARKARCGRADAAAGRRPSGQTAVLLGEGRGMRAAPGRSGVPAPLPGDRRRSGSILRF